MAGTPAAGEPADYPAAGREGYEIRTRAPEAPRSRPSETTEQRYLRQIRNAVSFIAIIIGMSVALGLISFTIVAVAHITSR
ncbi:MAG TPA: hypothetical protein VGG25_13895 [Streptosporangiaceae bacterium]